MSTRVRTIAIVMVLVSTLGVTALSAQDKYTVKEHRRQPRWRAPRLHGAVTGDRCNGSRRRWQGHA